MNEFTAQLSPLSKARFSSLLFSAPFFSNSLKGNSSNLGEKMAENQLSISYIVPQICFLSLFSISISFFNSIFLFWGLNFVILEKNFFPFNPLLSVVVCCCLLFAICSFPLPLTTCAGFLSNGQILQYSQRLEAKMRRPKQEGEEEPTTQQTTHHYGATGYPSQPAFLAIESR